MNNQNRIKLALKRRTLSIALITIFASSLLVWTLTTFAAVNNYTVTRATGITYSSISGTGTSVTAWRNALSTDDNMSTTQPIGFPFIFNGGAYTGFLVSTNGFITFNTGTTAVGGTTAPYNFQNTNFFTSGTSCSCLAVAPFYDDLQTAANAGTLADLNASIKYQTTGVAGSRILTVEWINFQDFSTTSTASLNFQVKLYEADGHIEFVYGTMTPAAATWSYTSGINAASLSATPTAAELQMQTVANSTTFSNTPLVTLATVPATNTQINLTPPAITPAAPTTLTFPTIGASFVTLNWTDNATNEINYNILISTDGGVTFTAFGAIFPPNTTSVTISGLSASTTYTFRVEPTTEGVGSTLDGSVTTLAPVSGTKTIGPSGDYTSFAFAVSDVNAGLGAGGVTFNVAAGTTFPENGSCITGGDSTHPVVFQKSGAGANPVIQPPGSASTQDSGICILGGDFVTFDGIDVAVAGGNATVEYGALVFNLSATNGAQNDTIKNSKMTLNRTNTSSIGINQTFSVAATAATGANSNNKYYNITVENASRGILLNGTSATFNDTNNEIGITGGGTTTIGAATANDIGNGTASTYGITAALQFGVKIFNVEVRNVTGTSSGTVEGIVLSNTGSTTTSVGTNQIFNNKIHDLNNTSTSAGVVRGIRENLTNNAASVSQIYNNFIWGLDSGSTSTTSRRIIGINLQDGGTGTASTHNVQFNSVRLAPTGVACPNSTFEIGVASNINKVQDNIFANFTGAQTGSAKHYTWVSTSSTAIGGAGTVSDFNDLYIANTTNGFVGLGSATDFATLTNWQTILAGAGPDDNSKSSDPKFVSATDLHIQTGVPTPVEGMGTPIAGITTDIDGDTRNATTPDIGADEGAFIPLPANDIAATAIITPATGSVFQNGASTTPQASFTNVGTATQTNISVQFTITGPGGYNYTDSTQVIASLAPGVTTTVTFVAAPAFTTAGTYTTTATVLTPDAFAGNNTVSGSFIVFDPITGGTVSVGTGQPYGSLTNAGGVFAAINAATVTSNITVNVTSNLTTETGTVALNQVASGFTVTIKPSGAARTISGSASAALIKLNGADNVTIDGSLSGGTDRSLTITNTNNAAATAAIWLSSLGTGLGATNDTVKNCNISCGVDQSTSTNETFGILSSGTSISTSNDGADNDTNTFDNNAITKARWGIYVRGAAANTNDNNIVRNNLIGPSAFGVNQIGKGGIVVQLQNAVSITTNEVRFVGGSSSGTDRVGIGLGDSTWPQPTGTAVTNSLVTRNLIHDVTDEGTFSSVGLNVAGTGAPSGNTVANNMISNIRANGTSGDQCVGLGVGVGTGDNVVFNSVYLTGDIDPGVTSTASSSAGGAVINSTPTNLTFKDNVLFVDVTSNTSTLKHFALIKGSATQSFGTGGLDFNDYWVLAANPQSVLFGNGTSATSVTSVTTLALWQAETPAHDANSRNFDPLFVNAATNDLHLLATSPVLSFGTPIASVTNDFDNDPRPAVNPDIGADEVVQAAVGGAIPAGTFYNASANGGNTFSGDTTITNSLTVAGVSTTGASTVTIDCNASVTNAGTSNYINGNVKKNFCAPGAFSYPVGGATSGYSPLNVNVTALGINPSGLTVKVTDGVAPASPTALDPAHTLAEYWTLTETGDLTANLVFNYNQNAVMGNENNYQLTKIEGGGTPTRFPVAQAPVDPNANTATINGVMNFSDWTLSEPFSPTSGVANISGHVLTNNGQPLSGVSLMLLDTVTSAQATVTTDANGLYQFADVLTGRDFVVTPTRNGYGFNPQNRAFSHTGVVNNMDFMAAPDGTSIQKVTNDFDGDGKTDLSVWRPSSGTWYIMQSSTGVMRADQWGTTGDHIVPADYDGDGKTDIAVFRPSNASWYIYQSTTNTLRAVQWGLSDDVATPADYDGDGKADVAVWRASTGTWYILQSSNGQMRSFNWGTSGDKPVAADYDGDGRADIAVFRPSTATWYIVNSSNSQNRFEQWGIATDRPVVGDYDGDGKSDLAVFRVDNATWYVKLSTNGSLSAQALGTSADRLVPGDYDGDGKTDRAVWQTADGNWQILRSTTNASTGQKWGTNGDVPAPSAYVP